MNTQLNKALHSWKVLVILLLASLTISATTSSIPLLTNKVFVQK